MQYTGNGCDAVSWCTVSGNLQSEGKVVLQQLGAAVTEIQYSESVAPDLPITPLLATLFKPIVAREVRQGIAEFLDRIERKLSRAFQWSAGAIFLWHLIAFATLTTLLFMAGAIMFLGVVYNTFWYHRYCSHKAFRFRSLAGARVFLWTSPLVMREEVYALPHRVHHRCADRPGDPYGPHMGWLGAFLAQDSTFRINRALGPADYRRYRESMRHVGMVSNDHARFLRTGSIEAVGWYAVRMLLAQSFWGVLMWGMGGLSLLTAWYGAIFVIWCIVRDFQWRGHGGAGRRWQQPGFGKRRDWEFDPSCAALNQRFYGYFVAEWHDNHHLYPASANLAFLDGQLDLAFLLVRALHRLGIVSAYFDAKPKFISHANPAAISARE